MCFTLVSLRKLRRKVWFAFRVVWLAPLAISGALYCFLFFSHFRLSYLVLYRRVGFTHRP
jgi:hypothetical protein